MKTAKDLYLEAINSSDEKAISLLNEALRLEPYFFLAKEALIEIKGNNIDEYKNLLKEIDEYNNKNNISIRPGEYWTDENGNNRLSVLNRMMNIYQSNDKWSELEAVSGNMIELDCTNEFRQEAFYLLSLLMQRKYNELDTIINNKDNRCEYLIVGFLKSLILNKLDEAVEILKKLEDVNPNFAAIIFGVMIITDEDYERIFSLVKLDEGSPEEAFYYAQMLAGPISNINELFALCINTKFEDIKPMISAGELELMILVIIMNVDEIKKPEMICELRGIGTPKTDYFNTLSKASRDEVEYLIDSVASKGFITIDDNGTLKTTYLGYSVLRMMADSTKNA